MKKLIITIFISLFLLTSCGGSGLESDAKKLAKVDCDLKTLPSSERHKGIELIGKYEKLKTEFKSKYDNDYEKFEEAYKKALKNCN